jgi:membrane protease YdiL (CAAX protease family)
MTAPSSPPPDFLDGRLPRVGAPLPPETARSIRFEIVLVFLVTLGTSALRSIVDIIDALMAPVPLASQTVTIVAPQAKASLLDLIKQLLSISTGLAWGGLGLYLLWRAGIKLTTHLGLDLKRPWKDLAGGVLLAAIIGIPGLGFYLVAHAAGINLTVAPAVLNDVWWRIPILIFAAIENGFLEEVLVVGYLLTRLEQLGVKRWPALLISSVLRGGYHLYQGFGGFIGNAIMGIVFGWAWQRWRRLWPLVIAHSLIDIVAFVGYGLLRGHVNWLP